MINASFALRIAQSGGELFASTEAQNDSLLDPVALNVIYAANQGLTNVDVTVDVSSDVMNKLATMLRHLGYSVAQYNKNHMYINWGGKC